MAHHCHAMGCEVPVPARLLMCRRHWFMVPAPMRGAVLRHFRPGQCDDKKPSRAWLEAAIAAVKHVATVEGRLVA